MGAVHLRQVQLISTYGLLFVPEDHAAALDHIKAQVRSHPHGVRLIRGIEDRWFYFDYD